MSEFINGVTANAGLLRDYFYSNRLNVIAVPVHGPKYYILRNSYNKCGFPVNSRNRSESKLFLKIRKHAPWYIRRKTDIQHTYCYFCIWTILLQLLYLWNMWDKVAVRCKQCPLLWCKERHPHVTMPIAYVTLYEGAQQDMYIILLWKLSARYSVWCLDVCELVMITAWSWGVIENPCHKFNDGLATQPNPDSNAHGANMGPIWGRQDPGGPHVGPVNVVIRES